MDITTIDNIEHKVELAGGDNITKRRMLRDLISNIGGLVVTSDSGATWSQNVLITSTEDAKSIINNLGDSTLNITLWYMFVAGLPQELAEGATAFAYSNNIEAVSSDCYERIYSINGGFNRELTLLFIQYINGDQVDQLMSILLGENTGGKALLERYARMGYTGMKYGDNAEGLAEFIWAEGAFDNSNGGLDTFTFNGSYTYEVVRNVFDDYFFK